MADYTAEADELVNDIKEFDGSNGRRVKVSGDPKKPLIVHEYRMQDGEYYMKDDRDTEWNKLGNRDACVRQLAWDLQLYDDSRGDVR